MATESTPFPTSSDDLAGDAGKAGTMSSGGLSSSASSSMPGSAGSGHAASAQPGAGGSGQDMLRRVVAGAHETIDRLADRAAPAVDRLSESVSGANERMHVGADQMRELGTEWAESVRATVRENPLAAVGVALALGVLIARLSR